MRGRPLLELCLLLVLWGLLAMPLWRVTRSGAREAVDTISVDATPAPVWVAVHFTEPPTAFRLYSRDTLVWEEAMPAIEQEQPLDLVWDALTQGEMLLVAVWGEDARRATEVRIAPPVGPARAVTLWHEDAEIEELLLFP